MFKLVLEKAEEPEIKLPKSGWIIKKARELQKNISFWFIDISKALTVWITINCRKFFKRWEYQNTWPASWEICMQVRKQQLELDMEKQTGSKSGKESVKAVYCHPAYLTHMQSTLCEMQGWSTTGIKTARRNINNLRYADNTTAESKEELKTSGWKWKRRVKKLA